MLKAVRSSRQDRAAAVELSCYVDSWVVVSILLQSTMIQCHSVLCNTVAYDKRVGLMGRAALLTTFSTSGLARRKYELLLCPTVAINGE